MKEIAALVLSLTLFGCATKDSGNSTEAAKSEVLAATDLWRAAYDSREPARITALYAKQAVFWGTTMKTVATSPEAIAEYFKDAAARPNARVVFTEQHVRVYGDVALNGGTYTFKDNRDGREILNPSHYSMVFQRHSGTWVLVHHHSSRVAP